MDYMQSNLSRRPLSIILITMVPKTVEPKVIIHWSLGVSLTDWIAYSPLRTYDRRKKVERGSLLVLCRITPRAPPRRTDDSLHASLYNTRAPMKLPLYHFRSLEERSSHYQSSQRSDTSWQTVWKEYLLFTLSCFIPRERKHLWFIRRRTWIYTTM